MNNALAVWILIELLRRMLSESLLHYAKPPSSHLFIYPMINAQRFLYISCPKYLGGFRRIQAAP